MENFIGFQLQMGAPKQKWTAEEEAALKAGVLKHGAGKWRTILKDPEFSGILYLRSNVDLKVIFFFITWYFSFCLYLLCHLHTLEIIWYDLYPCAQRKEKG